jgi:hypothetical protein
MERKAGQGQLQHIERKKEKGIPIRKENVQPRLHMSKRHTKPYFVSPFETNGLEAWNNFYVIIFE